MGGNLNFGSRSEFLPGERTDDIDIKYERYGGCFVTYKKAFFYLLASLAFTGIVSYLVYHYLSCSHDADTEDQKADNFLAELLKTAQENESEATKDDSKISTDINPLFYNLKIQPYLDESNSKNFTFEGQVSIVFEITNSPTKTIILNAKDLEIPENSVSVTYTSSKIETAALVAESQVKEENVTSNETMTTTSTTHPDAAATTIITTAVPITSTSPENTTEAVTTGLPISSEETNSSIATTVDATTSDASGSSSTTSSSATVAGSETSSSESSNTTSNSSTASSEASGASGASGAPEVSGASEASGAAEASEGPKSETTTVSSTTSADVITESKENNLEISKQTYDEDDETFTVKLKLPLEKGINYTLNIKFTGNISDGYGGILRSSYKQGNDTKWVINTLLKPSFARTVFPCFDQPNFKTKFEIAIARRTNMAAVSNMFLKDTYPVKDTTGWVWDHFEMTPAMSTHSVAFAVFGFNSTDSKISVPYPLTKLWGRTEIENKGKYTLDIAPKLVERYNSFFGYNYSLNKVDLVAVPNLPVGSYGSWGILFFRENELLVEDDSSFEDKEHLLHSLSRELAQEWFGNLISVQSWNDSWLTETISNYAHYVGMNAVEPTWDIMDETFISDKQDVLDIDTTDLLPKITSMSANFERDFDQQLPLAKKGSSVIHMLNSTEPELNSGIQKFINKWKYKNFVQDNFWEELNSQQNLPTEITVKDIINLWISQKGYPLITITQNENNSISIQQEKFSENQMPSIDIWIISLQYISSSDTSGKKVWLWEKSPKLIENVTDKQNSSWIFFSSQAPCRINYELDNWKALISLLKSSPETLSPANRAQLLDDAFHLARAGLLNYSVVLDMTAYLREKEQHIIPWTTALKNFEYLNLILSKTPSYDTFEDLIVQLLMPTYEKLITDTSNDYKVVKLKKIIINLACKLNYQPCKDWAISQYDTWTKSTNPDTENSIQKDLRPTVYCMGVQNHGRTAWEFLWQRYQNAKVVSDESKALINGMSCSTESWLLMKFLSRALEEESLQNSVLMWTSMSSELAVTSAFEFLKENWSKVHDKYKRSNLAYKQILHGVLSKLTSPNDLENVLEMFTREKSNLKEFAQDMIVIIEKLKQKISWKKLYMTNLNSWIQENGKNI